MPDIAQPGQTLSGPDLTGWTLVFDLDGTLVETAPDLLGALNHVLAGEGLAPVSLTEIRTMIGHGAKAMIRKGLAANGAPAGEARVEALWPAFIAHYQDHIADHSQPFPEIVGQLGAFRAAGARLAVCTNKTQALSVRLLEALGLDVAFDAVVGADRVARKKPDGGHILAAVKAAGGDPARAIMIGDSRTDERAALDAGLPFIFVTFGYEPAALSEIRADAVLTTYSDLPAALLELVS